MELGMSETVFLNDATAMLTNVHERADCLGACPIHSPSDHHMRDWPLNWRDDRGLMERICPHGVGHPDPDHLAHTAALRGDEAAAVEGVHGCDGCCSP
jgi:hypothetical protein